MSDETQNICKQCAVKDTEISSLNKQVNGLEGLKKRDQTELSTLKERNKEYLNKIKDTDTQNFFKAMKGKNDRLDDFKKLTTGEDLEKWDDVAKREFVKKYPFLIKEEKKPVSPGTPQATAGDSGLEKTDSAQKNLIYDDVNNLTVIKSDVNVGGKK